MSCAGEHSFRLARIRAYEIGPVGSALRAGQLLPGTAAVRAAIDPAAGARENQLRTPGVGVDREHIGIIEHPIGYGAPAKAAITCFPRQMRSAGVEDIAFDGIEGQ